MKKVKKILFVALLVLGVFASSAYAMTDGQRYACHGIIHSAATAAAGSAFVLSQAPGTDNIALAGILGAMTFALANVFDLSFVRTSAETVGISVITYFGGVIAARAVSQWLGGWIPLVGNSLNATSMALLVEFIGWEIAAAFESGNWAVIFVGLELLPGAKPNPSPTPTPAPSRSRR